jgi:hypothetical protein
MVDGKTNQGVKKRFKTFVYAMRRMPGQPESESVVVSTNNMGSNGLGCSTTSLT